MDAEKVTSARKTEKRTFQLKMHIFSVHTIPVLVCKICLVFIHILYVFVSSVVKLEPQESQLLAFPEPEYSGSGSSFGSGIRFGSGPT